MLCFEIQAIRIYLPRKSGIIRRVTIRRVTVRIVPGVTIRRVTVRIVPGAISENAENILLRLGIDDSQWLDMTSNFEKCFATFAGNEQRLRSACDSMNYQRTPGLSRCRAVFG
jgi:hypothetical protein